MTFLLKTPTTNEIGGFLTNSSLSDEGLDTGTNLICFLFVCVYISLSPSPPHLKLSLSLSFILSFSLSLSFSLYLWISLFKNTLYNRMTQVMMRWAEREQTRVSNPSGMWCLALNWIKSASNRTNPVHFGALRQNVLKSNLKKSRICPIWGEGGCVCGQLWHPWSRPRPSSEFSRGWVNQGW